MMVRRKIYKPRAILTFLSIRCGRRISPSVYATSDTPVILLPDTSFDTDLHNLRKCYQHHRTIHAASTAFAGQQGQHSSARACSKPLHRHGSLDHNILLLVGHSYLRHAARIQLRHIPSHLAHHPFRPHPRSHRRTFGSIWAAATFDFASSRRLRGHAIHLRIFHSHAANTSVYVRHRSVRLDGARIS